MELTQDEIEDVKYEMWLLDDGPSKATAKHKALAEQSIVEELEPNGWTVIEQKMRKPAFEDVTIMELVVRKGDKLRILSWSTFNKGWMQKSEESGGSFIFRPTE